MEHVSSFFKEENDIFYRLGEKKGMEKGIEQGMEKGIEQGVEQGIEETEKRKNLEFVKNLLLQTELTIEKIASLCNVTEAFVRRVKKGLTPTI